MEGKGFGSSLFLWRCDMIWEIIALCFASFVLGAVMSYDLLKDEDEEEDQDEL